MIPTAVSHLVEQLIRVCAILVLAIIFIEQGSDAYGAGIGAAYGSLLGGVVSLFVLFSFSKHLKNRHQWFQLKGTNRRELVKKSLTIFKQSLFICLSALVFILFQFIDVFSLIRLLGWYGLYGEDAYLAKGIYDRGQPLLQLGTVLTMTFSLTLVPLLAKAVAKNELILARSYHDLALRLTFLIGGAATIGLMVVIEPTNSMLFTDRSGSDVLRILSVAIIASTLSMTLSAILQGYGYVHLPALVLGIGVMSKIIFNVVLVPMYGTKGAAFATVLSFAMMVVIQLQLLKRITGKISVNYHSYRAIAITFILMFITTSIWKRAIETLFTNELTRILETALAISTVGIGGLTVLVGLLRFGILSESEWETIPRLERLRQLVVRKRS
jgi:PST family polysaccharide transporter